MTEPLLIPCLRGSYNSLLSDLVWLQLAAEWVQMFGSAVKDLLRPDPIEDYTLLEPINLVPFALVAAGGLSIWRSDYWSRKLQIVRWMARVAVLSGALSVGFLHCAMAGYSGGRIGDINSRGYSLTKNLLSDLGRFFPWNSDGDHWSATFFILALSLASVAILCQAWSVPFEFKSESSRRFAFVATVASVFSAWFVFRIAWCPIDWNFDAHQLFAVASFVTLGAWFSTLLVARLIQGGSCKPCMGSLAASCAFIAGYLLLRYCDGEQQLLGTTWLFRQATAQKVVVYSAVVCVLMQVRATLLWVDAKE